MRPIAPLALLASLLALGSFCACNRTTAPDRDRFAELLEIQSTQEDLEPFGGADHLAQQTQRAAKQKLFLQIDGVRHAATDVYLCRELSGPKSWRCVSSVTHADDTIHTTEFDHDLVSTSAAQGRFVDASDGVATGLVRAGIGDPREMHDRGYEKIVALDPPGATFALPSSNQPRIVFAIAKGPSGWLRKHVWVVRSD